MKKLILTLLVAISTLIGLVWSVQYVIELTRFQTLAVVQETADSSSYTIVRDRLLHVTYKIERNGYVRKINEPH